MGSRVTNGNIDKVGLWGLERGVPGYISRVFCWKVAQGESDGEEGSEEIVGDENSGKAVREDVVGESGWGEFGRENRGKLHRLHTCNKFVKWLYFSGWIRAVIVKLIHQRIGVASFTEEYDMLTQQYPRFYPNYHPEQPPHCEPTKCVTIISEAHGTYALRTKSPLPEFTLTHC
jgi:hypothetical protein